MTEAIQIINVSKNYGDMQVLEQVNFSVRSGSILGLVGRNGAGKTTLLSILLGLTRANSGDVHFFGKPMKDRISNDIGFSINQGLFPSLTAKRHLQLISSLSTGAVEIDALLRDVDLGSRPKQKVKNFSLGMQQRLRLAISLSGGNRIIVLDEPLNGLDPDGVSWLRQRLLDLRDEGKTVLLSSHLLLELEKVVDDVVILDRKILWSGSIENAKNLSPEGSLESFYHVVKTGDRNG